MIVIIPRHPRRYSGSGIFGNIFKKVFNSTTKDVIKKAAQSAAAQKLANAVVSGTASGAEKLAGKIVADLKRKKHKGETQGVRDKRVKVDVSEIINSGGGIVLD